MANARACSLLLLLFWTESSGATLPSKDPATVCQQGSKVNDEVSLLQVASKLLTKRVERDPGSEDRYPAIYIDLKQLLRSAEDPNSLKLLSFGCGEGKETRTLRKYFPHATVHGVDPDRTVISQNMGNNSDSMLHYFDSTNKLDHDSYDVVLALSVLCSRDPKSILPYHTYDQSMQLLDRLVKPGGYLVLYNSNYPFYEFMGSNRYEGVAETCNVANENVVEKLDQRGSVSPHSWNRGWCTQFGRYCTESGWRAKFSKSGQQLQPSQPDNSMSFGCIFPGTIYRKVKSHNGATAPKRTKPVKLDSVDSMNAVASPLSIASEDGESTESYPAEAFGHSPISKGKSKRNKFSKGKFGKSASLLRTPKFGKKQMVTVIYSNMD